MIIHNTTIKKLNLNEYFEFDKIRDFNIFNSLTINTSLTSLKIKPEKYNSKMINKFVNSICKLIKYNHTLNNINVFKNLSEYKSYRLFYFKEYNNNILTNEHYNKIFEVLKYNNSLISIEWIDLFFK